MKIPQDVRDYAATLNDPALEATVEKGMAEMSEKFKAMDEQIYIEVQRSNRNI